MAVPWYDNLEATPIDGVTCLVEVDRTYGFDWDRFGPDDWDALGRSFEGLPGGLGRPPEEPPMWFGDDEDVPPFLEARRQPPGLRVFGVLPEADWRSWDERFRAATTRLPARKSS